MAKKIRILKIAVLGAGYMGQNHVKILSSLPNVSLIAVCDIDKQKTDKLAKQYKIRQYSNFLTLFEKEALDTVSICLPTTLHYSAAVQAIKRRLPIFLEKPICSTVREAKKLTALAKKHNIAVMVGHIERFNPVVNEIKQRIASGELGKIIKIHTQRFSPPPSSTQDVSVIVDLATHDIDVMRYILNESPISIFSETNSHFHKKEVLMSALLRFPKDIIGLVEVSWLHPIKTRNLTIIVEHGMYLANYLTQELFFYRQNKQLFKNNFDPLSAFNRADVVKIAFESKEPLYLELKAFTESLINRKDMPVTAKDGLIALDVAEKMTRSANSRRILK